jgi:hypothetical protein
MVMMLRCFLTVLFAAVAFGQANPPAVSPQPPPELDRALRARINAFYDLLVNRQYRRAEEIVAPDTRDVYYERDKPRYISFELKSIKYSDNFTRAEATTIVKVPPTSAMIPVPMDTPVASIWRLMDGAWYWSIPKINVTDLLKSMTGVAASPDGNAAPAPPVPPPPGMSLPTGMGLPTGAGLPSGTDLPGGMGTPASIPMMGTGEGAAPKLSLDRPDVTLKASATEKVTITNAGAAPMTLFLLGKLPGIEATFDQTTIKEGERAVLSIKAAKGAKSGNLLIGVTETKEMISVPVFVK